MADRSAQARLPALAPQVGRFDLGSTYLLYDKAIREHGARAVLSSVARCPCFVDPRDGGDGVPESGCPACGATPGRYYDAEASAETRAVVGSLTQDPQALRPEGMLSLGTVRFTFPSDVPPLNYWDRVTLPDAVLVVQENRKLDSTPEATLRFQPQELRAVYTRDPGTRAIIKLRVGADVRLDGTKVVVATARPWWHAGLALAVTYLGNPPFYVMDLPHEYRGRFLRQGLAQEAWQRLPSSAIARRGDLITAAG